MPRKKRNSGSEAVQDKNKVLNERLRLIKQRHQELILKPRRRLLRDLFEGDAFADYEEPVELEELEEVSYRLE